MKKSMFVIAIAVLFSAIFSSSQATEAIEPTEVVWEKNLGENKEVFYSVTVKDNYCVVKERADGDLDLFATEPNQYGRYVSNHVLVDTKNGRAESNSTALYINSGLNKDDDLPVFFIRCVDAAMQLPPEVKAKFNGVYGIK